MTVRLDRPGFPNGVCVPDRGQRGDRGRYASASYLGVAYDPVESGSTPTDATSAFPIPPNLSLAKENDLSRLEDRLGSLRDLDGLPRMLDANSSMAGLDGGHPISELL